MTLSFCFLFPPVIDLTGKNAKDSLQLINDWVLRKWIHPFHRDLFEIAKQGSKALVINTILDP